MTTPPQRPACGVQNGTLESMSESQVKRNRVVVKKVNADTEGVRTDFLKRGTMARGAAETGIAENYLNALMARAAPGACASFLGSFFADKTQGLFKRGELFLVWKYEVRLSAGSPCTRQQPKAFGFRFVADTAVCHPLRVGAGWVWGVTQSDATLEDFVENRIGAFPGNLHEVFLSERVVQQKDEDELTYLAVQKCVFARSLASPVRCVSAAWSARGCRTPENSRRSSKRWASKSHFLHASWGRLDPSGPQ